MAPHIASDIKLSHLTMSQSFGTFVVTENTQKHELFHHLDICFCESGLLYHMAEFGQNDQDSTRSPAEHVGECKVLLLVIKLFVQLIV